MSQVVSKAWSIYKAWIHHSRYFGIIPPKASRPEPWEAELLLISILEASEDLTPLAKSFISPQDLEPGTAKYYLVKLPKRDLSRKPGPTSISNSWLEKPYDLYSEALSAFNNARP